ncbi:hypothetical protein YQE_10021, partial [Dendroctonus ponderosae]
MSASWALLLACLLFEGRAHTSPQRFPSSPYSDWDYLMFSQRWPQTTCSEWEEANSANSCNLPKDRNLWTIHGVWPTKTGKARGAGLLPVGDSLQPRGADADARGSEHLLDQRGGEHQAELLLGARVEEARHLRLLAAAAGQRDQLLPDGAEAEPPVRAGGHSGKGRRVAQQHGLRRRPVLQRPEERPGQGAHHPLRAGQEDQQQLHQRDPHLLQQNLRDDR